MMRHFDTQAKRLMNKTLSAMNTAFMSHFSKRATAKPTADKNVLIQSWLSTRRARKAGGAKHSKRLKTGIYYLGLSYTRATRNARHKKQKGFMHKVKSYKHMIEQGPLTTHTKVDGVKVLRKNKGFMLGEKSILMTGKVNIVTHQVNISSDTFPFPMSNEVYVATDSGATVHVAKNNDQMIDYVTLQTPFPVQDAGGKIHRAIGRGTIRMTVLTENGRKQIVIKDVLHVPGFALDYIMSVRMMRNQGFGVHYPPNAKAYMMTPAGERIELHSSHGLEYLALKPFIPSKDDGIGRVNLSLVPKKQFDAWLKTANPDDILARIAMPHEGDNKKRVH